MLDGNHLDQAQSHSRQLAKVVLYNSSMANGTELATTAPHLVNQIH
jgi:hypothetical protein